MLSVGNWLMTTPWNLVDFPAISLPGGISSAATPIGAQLVATPGSDLRLLSLARQIEELKPWQSWNVD